MLCVFCAMLCCCCEYVFPISANDNMISISTATSPFIAFIKTSIVASKSLSRSRSLAFGDFHSMLRNIHRNTQMQNNRTAIHSKCYTNAAVVIAHIRVYSATLLHGGFEYVVCTALGFVLCVRTAAAHIVCTQ